MDKESYSGEMSKMLTVPRDRVVQVSSEILGKKLRAGPHGRSKQFGLITEVGDEVIVPFPKQHTNDRDINVHLAQDILRKVIIRKMQDSGQQVFDEELFRKAKKMLRDTN